MPDVRLKISAEDTQAQAVLQALIDALRSLATQGQATARSTNQLRDASGRFTTVAKLAREEVERQAAAQVDNSRAAIQAARESARAQQQATRVELAALREAAQQRTAALETDRTLTRERLQVERQAAAQAAAAAREGARAQQQATQAETQALRAATVNRTIAERDDRRRIAALHAESRERAAALHTQAAQLRLQQAQTTQQTAATRAQAAAALQQARAQQQAANNAARAALQQRRISAQNARALQAQGAAVLGLVKAFLTYRAVIGGIRLFRKFIEEGLEFNEMIQSATLGIASILTATTQIQNPFGQTVRGAEALDVALKLSADQMNKLRIAGIQTAATTEQLVDAFQSAVAAGTAAGLTLDQIRQISVQITQAAGAIGVPMQQLNQEVRSILDATIDRNSRVARVLGITNEQVRLAKEQNRLAEFLNEKLQAFTTAGERATQTFRVMKSNLQEALQVFAGSSIDPLFEGLTRAGNEAFGRIFDFSEPRIRAAFQPLVRGLQVFFDELGQSLGGAFESALDGAQELGDWLERNREAVRATAEAFVEAGEATLAILGGIVDVVAALVQSSTESEDLAGSFRSMRDIARAIADLLHGWADAIRDSRAVMLATAGAATVLLGTLLALSNPVAALVAGIGLVAVGIVKATNDAKKLNEELDRAAEPRPTIGNLVVASEEEVQRQADIDTDTASRLQRLIEIDKLLRDQNTTLEKANRLRAEQEALVDDLKAGNADFVATLKLAAADGKDLNTTIREFTQSFIDGVAGSTRMLRLERDAATKAVEEWRALRRAQGRSADPAFRAELKRRLDALDAINAKLRTMVRPESEVRRLQDLLDALGSTTGRVPDPDRGKKGKAANDLKQAVEARIQALKAALARAEEELDGALERNEISFQAYADELGDIRTKTTSEIIRQLGILLSATTDKGERAKILADQVSAREGLIRETEKTAQELRKRYQGLADDVSELNARALEATGQAAAAEAIRVEKEFRAIKARLAAEIDDLKGRLAQAGPGAGLLVPDLSQATEQQADALVAEFERLGNRAGAAMAARLKALLHVQAQVQVIVDERGAKAAMEDLSRTLEQAQAEAQRKLAAVQTEAQVGTISQAEARRRVVAIYEDESTQLTHILLLMQAIAATSKDPDVQKALEQLVDLIRQIQGNLRAARLATQDVALAVGQALKDSIQNFLTSGIPDIFQALIQKNDEAQQAIQETADQIDAALEAQGVDIQTRTNAIAEYMAKANAELDKTVGLTDVLREAFRSMALDVIRAIQQIIAQLIAMQAVAAIGRLIGGSFGSALSSVATQGVGAAEGGYVWGPGTDTSDSIPARLSRGEYVLSARAVRRIGKEELDAINFGWRAPAAVRRRGRYATGGFVEGPSVPRAGESRLAATIGLEEGLVLRHLSSPPGQRALVQVIRNNRLAIRQALGS